jgi:dolichol-phosphate mannosyltransferase
MTELSVVIPVYNAEGCLTQLQARLTRTLREMKLRYEIILVDDRSSDASWSVIRDLAKQEPAIKALRLSRNFGQQAAITAGLELSDSNWVVVMDCDLQDPPEDIPRLYAKALEGFDLVLARRKKRQHSFFRRTAAQTYFRMLGLFNQTSFDHDYGAFSIVSRKVVRAFLTVKDTARHYLLLLYWLGFAAGSIEYEHGDRFSGRSAYSISRLITHAFEGLFFQTTIFLKWIIYMGFALAGGGFVFAAYLVTQYFAHGLLPGWTSLAVLILVVGGFTITSIGVAGLYIGKIFEQVKGRPLFVVSEKIVDGDEQ